MARTKRVRRARNDTERRPDDCPVEASGDIIKGAQLGEDEDGQIVILTSLKMPSEGRAYPQPNQH